MHSKKAPPGFHGRAVPWLVPVLSAAVLAAWFWPGMRNGFLYDRGLIVQGQVWRLWSGHLAHHSLSHLLWNLAVFLPLGTWLERVMPRPARWFFVSAPLVISAVLWWFDPTLQVYAGLSGVTMGVTMLLAFVQLRAGSGEPRWIWLGLLVLVAAKIAMEFAQTGHAVFANLPDGVRNVPLAHLAGAGWAGLFAFAVWRQPAKH